MDDGKLAWQAGDKKLLYSAPILSVHQQTSTAPDGSTGDYVVIDAPDWVIVIPALEDPKRYVMVKQWRHGSLSTSIEFPGGVIDRGETPAQAAVRELLEETGYKAEKIIHLGSMSPNPAIFANQVHCYAAEDLVATGTQNLDRDEFVEYFTLSHEEVKDMMGTRDFPHALMTAAFELYRKYLETK